MRQTWSNETAELTEAEVDAVSGGSMDDVKAEAQMQQMLSSMVSDVIKNFGAAMQSLARG